MAKLKFMGTSHVHTLEKGDDFGGRLGEPLSKTVTFDKDNNWVVDTKEAGLSMEAVGVLLTDPSFKDVTSLKSIPLNDHQKIFLGMTGSEPAEEEEEEPAKASGATKK